MAGFGVNDEALQFAGVRLGEVVDDLESDFVAVRVQMDRLLDGGWSGGTARWFAQGWTEWLHGYHQSMSALRSMSQLLGETGVGYAGAEGDTLGRVRAIGAQLS